MSSLNDDDRYHDLLQLHGDLNRSFHAFKTEREKAFADLREEMLREIRFYWSASAAGLRQLSNWFAENEDAARAERAEAQRQREAERAKRDRRDRLIIRLLLIVIVLLGVGLGYLIGSGF